MSYVVNFDSSFTSVNPSLTVDQVYHGIELFKLIKTNTCILFHFFYYTSKSFILRCSPELFGKDFCITSYCSNNSLKDSFFFIV